MSCHPLQCGWFPHLEALLATDGQSHLTSIKYMGVASRCHHKPEGLPHTRDTNSDVLKDVIPIVV